jgi:Protein of unknown function (DUF1501)
MNTCSLNSRRSFIQRCAKSAFGLTVLPALDTVAAPTAPAKNLPGFGKAKHIIFIQLEGGLSHIDSFDPKGGSSKGPGATIKAKGGFEMTEYFAKTAAISDKICVIRNMTADIGVHGPAQYFMRTAFAQRNTIQHPNLGAWLEHYQGPSHKTLPSSACINSPSKHGNGFFPPSFSPIPILNPNTGLQNIEAEGGITALNKKLALANDLSSDFRSRYKDSNVDAYREFYDHTLRMLGSEDLKAFDLNQEKEPMRERYGKTDIGQGCLLARRLVESGVRYVEVSSTEWDMHGNLETHMEEVAPPFDQAYAALITDLDERGLLDSTLVVLATEFGRKPEFDGGGRGHYPVCFSTVLAGGGVKRGFVHGASDARGAQPVGTGVKVGDFHATIGWAAGAPLDQIYTTPSGRPFTIGGQSAKPVMDVFA